MSKPKSTEAEIILNRASVSLARSQRLISSWLPASSPSSPPPRTAAELEAEDAALFAPVPESLGVGATAPAGEADGSWRRRDLKGNEKLRAQLLGKSAGKDTGVGHRGVKGMAKDAGVGKQGQEGRERNRKNEESEEEEEEEGRAAAFKSKKGRKRGSGGAKTVTEDSKPRNDDAEGGAEAGLQDERKQSVKSPVKGRSDPDESENEDTRPVKRRAGGSYLDEILAEKAKKNKKKKRAA